MIALSCGIKISAVRHLILSQSTLVRPHLEYANAVWCPYKIGDIEIIENNEKVQKQATKLVIQLKKRPYTERLKVLDLHTLKYRRIRGDMTKIFKIVPQKYDASCSPTLQFNNRVDTRGNKYKLLNKSFQPYPGLIVFAILLSRPGAKVGVYIERLYICALYIYSNFSPWRIRRAIGID